MAESRSEKLDRARSYLRGKGATSDEYFKLAKDLKGTNDFGYARRLLARARDEFRDELVRDRKRALLFTQQLALCTYKDPDQPAFQRLERALEILKEVEDLDTTRIRKPWGWLAPSTSASGR